MVAFSTIALAGLASFGLASAMSLTSPSSPLFAVQKRGDDRPAGHFFNNCDFQVQVIEEVWDSANSKLRSSSAHAFVKPKGEYVTQKFLPNGQVHVLQVIRGEFNQPGRKDSWYNYKFTLYDGGASGKKQMHYATYNTVDGTLPKDAARQIGGPPGSGCPYLRCEKGEDKLDCQEAGERSCIIEGEVIMFLC